MHAQYDAIADQYQRSKSSPLRTFVEAPSCFCMLGGVSGLRVLDHACGEGFYTRKIKALDAERVVGVDVSAAMIRLADEQEQRDPLGIEYICADVEALPELGTFDIVTAAYLLHYAKDEQGLMKMCQSIFRHLRPGGRFITLNENPWQTAGQYAGYEQYGFNKTVETPRADGSRITYWMVAGRDMFKFDAFYYSQSTYERVLARAGFHPPTWCPLIFDPAGNLAHDEEYWQEYLLNPPIIGLECTV
jgi:ubiquinone/menaquinone biosynthesis C-methylase UbiE